MGERILQFDQDLFIYLNSLHTPWLDQVMFYMSNTYFWLPLHAILLYMILKNYRKDSVIIIICVALSVIVANGITSEFMKGYFMRLRPSHEHSLAHLIHIVNDYRGGLYGFASSHSATTFAMATFLWLLFYKRYPHIGWLFVWATLVAYTRVYLGVHYPFDILVGALIGILCGWAVYLLYQRILALVVKSRIAA